jgi:hypothetical protein
MNTDRSVEGDIAELFEQTSARREPDALLGSILSTTSRMRPRPRWLTLLKEPPMRFHSAIMFGSPTLRLSAVLGVAIALLVGIAGLAVAGASLQPSPIVEPSVLGTWRLESVTPSRGLARQQTLEDYEIEMTFGVDGAIAGHVGCKMFSYSYAVDGGNIDFSRTDDAPQRSGTAPGPCDIDDVSYFQMVDMLDRWAIEDGRLTLSNSEFDVPVAVFASSPSASAPSASPSMALYAMSSFQAPFTVDARLMETTWREHLDRPNWVYLGWRGASNEDDEGITFLYLDNLAVAPCGGSEEVAPWEPDGDGPSAFLAWLRQAGPISIGPVTDVTVGGHDGLRFDVTADRLEEECGGYLWVTQTEPDNGFVFLDGWTSRVTALDVDGATVLIVVADADPTPFPDLAADADELLTGLSFD